jgi:hypothetical protein
MMPNFYSGWYCAIDEIVKPRSTEYFVVNSKYRTGLFVRSLLVSPALLKFCHFFADPGSFVAMGTILGIAIDEDGHHPVGGSIAARVFQSGQKVRHQLVEFHALFEIGRSAVMENGGFFQIRLNVRGDNFSHGWALIEKFQLMMRYLPVDRLGEHPDQLIVPIAKPSATAGIHH